MNLKCDFLNDSICAKTGKPCDKENSNCPGLIDLINSKCERKECPLFFIFTCDNCACRLDCELNENFIYEPNTCNDCDPFGNLLLPACPSNCPYNKGTFCDLGIY